MKLFEIFISANPNWFEMEEKDDPKEQGRNYLALELQGGLK